MECRCRGSSSGLHASASIGTCPVCLLDIPPVSASSPVPEQSRPEQSRLTVQRRALESRRRHVRGDPAPSVPDRPDRRQPRPAGLPLLRDPGQSLPAGVRPRSRPGGGAGRRPRRRGAVRRARVGGDRGREGAARQPAGGAGAVAGRRRDGRIRADHHGVHVLSAGRLRHGHATPRPWPRCCPATGSTATWAASCSPGPRRIRCTRSGSPATPRRSSTPSWSRCWPSPTGSGTTSARPSGSAATQHFATTTRYEWMFWDAAYRQLAWPV